MRKLLALTLGIILNIIVFTQTSQGQLQVTPNGHYLQHADGTPFFWLGDTGWELFHRLTLEEIENYLDNRQAKGFNVIQAVILAEINGLRVPNRYGEVPLTDMDPGKPNEAYFRLVDTVIAMAESRGLIMALLPTWGDKVTLAYGGYGPVVFNTENAYRYGKFLGGRYKDKTNIVWVLGGDRPPRDEENDWTPIYAAMANGINEGEGKHTLKTFHPGGFIWESALMLHEEPWMDFNMIQSGHGEQDQPVWRNIDRDWNRLPAKPVIDSEPNYEDVTVNPWSKSETPKPVFTDYDVRKQLHRSVFAGGFGVSYGQSSVWRMHNSSIYGGDSKLPKWSDMLDRPGAFQAGYLRQLMESRPMLNRVADDSLIAEGQGVKFDYITAFKDEFGRYMMVYLPVGKTVKIRTTPISSKRISCWWYNPKDGNAIKIGKFRNPGTVEFTPPTLGVGNDWVLVIDDASLKYGIPGKHGKRK